MALAEKYGKNKLVWKDNVENFILLKSNEEYFTDPICKNGYFRGIETYNFVRDILSRYESYKKKIKAQYLFLIGHHADSDNSQHRQRQRKQYRIYDRKRIGGDQHIPAKQRLTDTQYRNRRAGKQRHRFP